jgi:steroid 5-alpha reductase family enzyme
VLASFLAPGPPTAWAAISVVVLFVLLWALSVRLRDVSIVDAFWGPSFVLVAAVVALTGSGDTGVRWLLLGMTALWGFRLGGFLLARFLRHDSEDPRYAEIRERHEGHFGLYSLVVIFGTQAVAVLIVSLPLQVVARSDDGVSAWVAVGLVVWAVGLVIEAVADEHQRRFSQSDPGDDEVLDTGLWRYSRHPNKFGDFCAWWGIGLVAATVDGAWWTLVGPVLMSVVLLRGTGAGDDGEGDSARAAYVRRTSGFVPLPPRGDGRG